MSELNAETARTRCTGTDCPGCDAGRRHYNATGCLESSCPRDHGPLNSPPSTCACGHPWSNHLSIEVDQDGHGCMKCPCSHLADLTRGVDHG